MEITLRDVGNSKGIVLPKALLAQAGLTDQVVVDLRVENGALVLRRAKLQPREGWAEAAAQIAQHNEALLMGEFANEGDAELTW